MSREKLALIQKTIKILESYSGLYNKISGGRHSDYYAYITSNTHADEQQLTKRIFENFLKDVLGFPNGAYIGESSEVTGERPDFIPIRRRLHSFVFELKGSEECHLENHLKQLFDYVASYEVQLGVLTNMRELKVYNPPSETPIDNYSFSFAQLYKSYREKKNSPLDVIDLPNTKNFLEFCERFKFRVATREDMVKAIREAADWSGNETLDIAQLDGTIHRVTRMLIEDARDKETHLPEVFAFHKERLRNIGAELEEIARQLDTKRERQAPNAKTLEQFSKAGEKTTEARALDVYLSRVAYFAMTRILLARVWEDVKLIEQSLYDGGFDRWYGIFNREIERVLDYAFGLAAKHYPWLYHAENNYKWFSPSGNTIIDVLYEFSEFNLGKLNTDLLGTVYEKYVEDRFEKKQKGLFYTPREIIRFIWDRAGFTNDEAFFRMEGKSRGPRYIFDPASGSGGFLVEAARRIIEEAHYDHNDLESLFSIHDCVTEGLQGAELNVFAHYITEVNLLIQFTPLIKEIMRQREHLKLMPSLKLSTVAADSMSLLIDPIGRKSKLNNNQDEVNGYVDLTKETRADPNKVETYHEIRERQNYDYCCANPPYVGEKGHKELFRNTRENFPVWNTHYQGKMDYFYWFIILGLAKLREGGKLSYITRAEWPIASSASKLRRYVLDNALLLEIIDFRGVKIFEAAPGQRNLVFVLERLKGYNNLPENSNPSKGTKRKQSHRIKIVRVKNDIPENKGNGERSRLARLAAYIQEHIDKDSYEDEFIEVYWSLVKQAELDENSWAKLWKGTSLFDLKRQPKVEPLGGKKAFEIRQGLVSGGPKVTSDHLIKIPQGVKEECGIKEGDGIYVLSESEVASVTWTEEELERMGPYYRQTQIDPFYADEDTDQTVLYITKKDRLEDLPNVKKHLSKYMSILMLKRETQEGKLPWHSMHWPRERRIFESEKIVTPNFAKSNHFAYVSHPFYTEFDCYYILKREGTEEDLRYVVGILNSTLMNKWIDSRCKHKGDGKTRVYNSSLLNSIPIRRIDFTSKRDVQHHDKMVELVEEMIETKKELSRYSPYYEGIRLTRLEGPENLKELDPDPLLVCKDLPQNQRRLLKLHPNLSTVEKVPEAFILTSAGKIDKDIVEGYILTLRGKGKKQAILKGEKEFLKYLQGVLANRKGAKWEEIKNLPVPLDTSALKERIKGIGKKAKRLLRKVEKLQKKIDQLVYKLYDLTEDEIAIVDGENKGS